MNRLIQSAIGLVILLNVAVEAHAAPVNDNFANATILSTYYDQREGTTVAATKEPLEPNSDASTIWYRVTTPNHPCVLNIGLKAYTSSYYYHWTRVYLASGSGGLSQLVEVGNFGTPGGSVRSSSFSVSGSTTYYVRVGAQYTSEVSPVQLTVDITPKDTWSAYYRDANAYFAYFASLGQSYNAYANYYYLVGMGDYAYYTAFGSTSDAWYGYWNGHALFYYYALWGQGNTKSALYQYYAHLAYGYYYFYVYKGQSSNASLYFNYFMNQANASLR